MKRVFLSVFSIILLSASAILAQAPTGSILGVVKDDSGAAVPGANVTAKSTATNQARTAVTGEDGAYRMDSMPVGDYQITVEKEGFKSVVQTGLNLTIAQEAAVSFTLQVGSTTQTVEVTGEAPLVSTTTSSLGGLVDEQRIVDLPLNGRNYLDLTLLQAGVTQHAYTSPNQVGQGGLLYSSNGAPYRSNNYLLDGAMLQNLPGGNGGSVIGNSLGVDGIREYRVITNSFSAEYGMTMGSQMVLVSKGGSNQFHGDVFDFLRNSDLDARNFFDLPTSKLGHRIPEFERNNFGGAAGGPIIKDKTFFFATYEGLRFLLGTTNTTPGLPSGCQGTAGQSVWNGVSPQPANSVGNCSLLGGTSPTATMIQPQIAPFLALYPAPNIPGSNNFGWVLNQSENEDYGQVRIDQTISNNDNLFGRATVDQAAETYPQSNSYQQYPAGLQSRNQYYTVGESHVFNTSTLNTARFSFSRTNIFSFSSATVTGNQYLFVQNLPLPADNQMGTVTVTGLGVLGPSSTAPKLNRQNIFDYSDDVNYTKGHHSFKFGADLLHYQIFVSNHGTDKGAASFSNLTNFFNAQLSSFIGLVPGALLDRTFHVNVMGFYAQDDWRVTPRLTVNLGLRYEPTTTYNEIYNHAAALRNVVTDTATTIGPPFKNPSLKNFSPRIGFAWDVFGDGKTAVRGGGALLYDVAEYGSTLSFSAQGTPPFVNTISVTSGMLTVPTSFPSTLLPVFRGPDYNMEQPHLLQYNLVVERQLPGAMAVTVAYAGSRGINLMSYVEGNFKYPQGVPVVTNGVDTGCVAPAAGTPVNLASQTDGSATSCFLGSEPRRNPYWGNMTLDPASADSFYNSLQLGLNKRLSKGLQFQASYTWSKLLDDQQAGTGSDNGPPHVSTGQDMLHPRNAYGRADFDIPSNFRFNAIYRLPKFSSLNGFEDKLLNGWWTSGILTLESGYGFSAITGGTRSLSGVMTGNLDRPDLVPGRNASNITSGNTAGCSLGTVTIAPGALGTPTRWFDPCAFSLEPSGFYGNSPRNFINGPGLADLDFSLVKDTSLRFLGEAGSLQFRTEVFNSLNRANFALPASSTVFTTSPSAPNSSSLVANAGAITRTINNARQIQFGVKLIF